MHIGARIRWLRLKSKLTQQQVADALGIDRSMLSRYEKGIYRLDAQLIVPLAQLYGVQPNDLFDLPPNADVSLTEVRVLGRVAANRLRLADQETEGLELVPSELTKGGDHYYLRVSGDCMAPDIPDGSFALVRSQPDVEDGERAVVIVGDEDGTLKRVHRMDGMILLKADNPSTKPILVPTSSVRILGKVVAVTTKL